MDEHSLDLSDMRVQPAICYVETEKPCDFSLVKVFTFSFMRLDTLIILQTLLYYSADHDCFRVSLNLHQFFFFLFQHLIHLCDMCIGQFLDLFFIPPFIVLGYLLILDHGL